jgi:hypothetical protein
MVLHLMQRLSRSLSRFETQDIKTQPRLNHNSQKDTPGRETRLLINDTNLTATIINCPPWVEIIRKKTSGRKKIKTYKRELGNLLSQEVMVSCPSV